MAEKYYDGDKNMIKLATIGTSSICESFIAGAKLTGKYELYAAYSRDLNRAKKFAEKHGFKKAFDSLEHMAACEEIDAVYIASPNVFHAGQTKLFLENGKHVLCEKPIATSASEYESLQRTADEKGLVYMEAIIPPHTLQYKDVKEALKSLGNIQIARIDFCQRSGKFDSFLRGENPNIFNMSLCAGALMDLGVYCVYAAVDFFGMPKNIYAKSSFLSNGADGSGAVVFEYDSMNVVITYSKTAQSRLGSEITGSDATLKIGSVGQYSDVIRVDKSGCETVIAGKYSKEELMSGEALRFADFILEGVEKNTAYKQAQKLCNDVHHCMDVIKENAKIVYFTQN